MTTQLIGLAGKAGTGKDTAADHLCEAHGFVRYAFADPIRAGLQAMLGLTDEELHDRTHKEVALEPFGVSPRRMMQTLGTEWGRHCIHPDLWLLVAGLNVDELIAEGRSGIVITDVRFDNEADWIRARGGTVLHILRPGADPVATHTSEAGVRISDEDAIINNVGSIQFLHDCLDDIAAII